jgi:hypothetical protein
MDTPALQARMRHNSQICRICGQVSFRPDKEMIQPRRRHWYHFICYLDAGKSLNALSNKMLRRFPYQLLRERKLLTPDLALRLRAERAKIWQ